MTEVPAGLGAWLAGRGLPGPEVRLVPLHGGHSNLTHRVVGPDGRTVVLRRPPPGPLEPGAHDVVREGAIIAALGATDVPVPRVLAVVPGGAADRAGEGGPDLGPALVMEEVDGVVLRTGADARSVGAAGPAAARHHAEALARLHRLDPTVLALPADLRARAAAGAQAPGAATGASPRDHVARLLDRWGAQVPRARPEHRGLLARTLTALREAAPTPLTPRLLHGDFRLDNVVVDGATGTVRAVLDWELATVGDPRTDLGSLLAVWSEPADGFRPLPDPPSLAPGMPDRAGVLAAYARVAGEEPPDLPYFVALACWKYACIVEGVHRRRAAGAPAHGPDPGELTGPLATRALELLG